MAATIRSATRNQRYTLPVTLAVAMLFAAGGQAQEKPRNNAPTATPTPSTGHDAKEIVSQPARDVGIEKTKIPPLLEKVSQDPYGTAGTGSCRQITAAIGDLNRVLGPDFSTSPQPGKRNVAKAGGAAIVNSLIPFRGLVREVSGAGPAERRLNAAIDAGFARRGFLRGLQRARSCR